MRSLFGAAGAGIRIPGIERSDVSEAEERGKGHRMRLRAPRPERHRRRSHSGATMAEFALIAPIGFLLIMTIIVVGIVITNWIQVTNVARAGARMAAICAAYPYNTLTATPPTDVLPTGSSPTLYCKVQDLETWMGSQLTAVPANSVAPSVKVCFSSTNCTTPSDLPSKCQPDALIQVQMTYQQPLYLPMISTFFESTPNTGIRTLTATAQAGCE